MITIIDYGLGNLGSVNNAFDRLGIPTIISSSPSQIACAERLVLPGVGAAESGMQGLGNRGLIDVLKKNAASGTPILGICLGMQLLFETSEEGNVPCLGLMKGAVTRLMGDIKIPQVGWNDIQIQRQSTITADVSDGSYMYFVNSYICVPSKQSSVIATTIYGQAFCSICEENNLYGMQFHPEKSGRAGQQLLFNFSTL